MHKVFFEGVKPVHKISFCAFLDVLGFSDRITTSYRNETGDQLLQEFYQIFTDQVSKMKDEFEDCFLYFKSFSDNVLLAHPQLTEEMESEFGFILWSIKGYQFSLALKGFFIRGGLSIGPLFIDEHNVYGQALIDAYNLENKIAVNPMVVLCDNTMELVKHHLTYYMGDRAPQLNDLLINSDGRYFINYLSECVRDTQDGDSLDIESLGIHRDRINEALSQYSDKPKVFSKFLWLSNYHNYFCDSVSSFQEYSDDLKVDDSLSRVEFKKLDQI